MDDVDTAVIGVRADREGFARDVAAMRDTLEGSLGTGAERAGRAIETSLLRAIRTGKLGFDDLRSVALSALGEIAAQALNGGVASVLGGSGGVAGVLAGLVGGLPGRATGGPVTPGRAYRVGERGPEMFVPTTSGRVEAGAAAPREVRVAITVHAASGEAPAALVRSSRQVARAVRAALAEE
jgi:phage-related minor tail protein